MKIGLIQVDGKWPNLALMKISAWHKKQGDSVEWYRPIFGPYDKVYASKIFTDTPGYPYCPTTAHQGGSGYNLCIDLPESIESCFPDYSLYPFMDYAMGFTTRGCPRRCPFCIVPQKEGKLRIVGNVEDFYGGQGKVVLLDNNLTAAPMVHFIKIMGQLKKTGAHVDFSQGLDLRLLTDEHCEALKGVRLWKQIHFAWDRVQEETKIMDGLRTFENHFPPRRAMIYVLIGFDSTPEDDMHRIESLRVRGYNPFIMPFNRRDSYQRKFARWVNHKAIFKSVAWADYN